MDETGPAQGDVYRQYSSSVSCCIREQPAARQTHQIPGNAFGSIPQSAAKIFDSVQKALYTGRVVSVENAV